MNASEKIESDPQSS